jgi:tetrapyrrole methylase family protein / MazG family protein
MSELGPESGIARLLAVVARLRGEQGCPWDRKQTLESLKTHLVEETYELVDAIDSGDTDQHLDELGDVLLQVALQSRIREENGDFGFDDVAARLAEKLVRRHPHVFGAAVAATPDDVLRHWERIKAVERENTGQPESVIAGVPRHLPALMKAQRVQSRAARVGFDWDHVEDVLRKIDEELVETREALAADEAERVNEEIGDLLFAVVNLCRFQRLDAENALSGAVSKFVRRFQAVEHRIRASGRSMHDCTLAELDAEWDTVKKVEKNAP